MADKAHRLTDERLEQMEKRLSAIYSEAEKDIQKKADEYFEKFKEKDEKYLKKYKSRKMTKEEYKEWQHWRRRSMMTGKRFTAMKEDIAKQLLNVNQTATAYINGELPEIYTLNYNALADTVDGVGGYSFTLLDRDTVKHLATTDTSLLPFRELDPAKDIPWNMKKINSQVLQGILQGESIPNISKRIMNVQEMNKDAAIRSARTIVTGAENKGRMDSYERATKDGIILKKYWIATPGKRTRDWHAQAGNDYTESKAIDVEKPFIVDGEEMMFPGDASSASGHNLYNCRCSMASVVKGFKKAQVEKAMEEKQEEQPTMQAKTKAEAETVARQFGVDADYSKYDISVANAINETMQEYVDIFGTHAFDNLNEISSFAKGEKLHEWGGYSSKGKSIKIRGVSSKDAIEKFGKTMEKYEDGYFSTSSNLHIIRHELGHSVHDVVEGAVSSELKKYRRSVGADVYNEISFRAGQDEYEFVAECLAQYLGGNPSKVAIEVVKLLKEGFRYKFG
jgi:hypothetical protein